MFLMFMLIFFVQISQVDWSVTHSLLDRQTDRQTLITVCSLMKV